MGEGWLERCRRMRVAEVENRKREERGRSDETCRASQQWSEGDAISRAYLVIMSLYFKVQSVPVMLLHKHASGEFPHRSDDKTLPARGSHTRSACHTASITNQIETSAFALF